MKTFNLRLTLLVAALGTGSALAGDTRLEAGLSFAELIGSSQFSATLKQRDYAEDGSFTASYKAKAAPGVGFDIQYNLNPRFGVRLGVQSFSRKSDATLDAQIPHPFFFSQPRKVSGTATGLGFSETAFTLTAVYRGGSGKWRVNADAGPAFFNVNVTMADRLNYGDVYPYDTVTFSGVSSSKKKVSPMGVSAGIEIGRQLSDAVTVVLGARYAGGSGDVDVSGTKVNVKAGGAQARLGIRIGFAKKN